MTIQKGHIKLGAPGALRDYLLNDPRQFAATPANPMAAKIATGAGKYDDFENWSYWVIEDWSAGAGRNADESANGYMFGDCATFMRGRLTLPFMNPVYGYIAMSSVGGSTFNVPYFVDGEMPIGTTQTYKQAALEITPWISTTTSRIWFYVFVDGVCSSAKLSIYSCTAGYGRPVTPMFDTTVDLTELHPGGQWIMLDFGDTTTNPATYDYWAVVEPAVAGEVLYLPYQTYDANMNKCECKAYKVATFTWDARSSFSNRQFFAIANSHAATLAAGGWAGDEIADMVYANGNTYAYGKAYMHYYYPYDPDYLASHSFDVLTYTGPVGAYDMQVWGDTIYIAHGTELWKLDSDEDEAEVGTDLAARVLAAWNGYLYRASGNQLWYTADGSTWTGPLEVGPSGTVVTGMAGLGEYLYIATEDGLYYLAPGDFVIGVAPWPTLASANGARMVNHNGALYVPMKNRIWQFTESGSFIDVWIDQGANFPVEYLGEIHSLATTHLGLVASVNPSTDDGRPTIWVLQPEGWHCLAVLPPGMGAGRVVADPTHLRLWMCTWQGFVWWNHFEPLASIPIRNLEQTWAPYGWMETDWYSGGLVDVPKDWESVTVFGEQLSATQYVSVYYKDSESADWTLLGNATANNTELRWEQDTYRPTSNFMKLGFLLRTVGDEYSTPVVRAIRTKYHPMVSDRWRWQLPITVHTSQEMLDGTLNSYTVAQQIAHLDGLVTQVAPVVFEDILGVQYEVKVLGASKQIVEFEALDGQRLMKWLYTLSLEQVTAETYA